MEQIALIVKAGAPAPGGEKPLRLGDEVVARVASPPGPDGRGELALAGAVHPARLPRGLKKGQKLRLRFAGTRPGELVLRIQPEDGPDRTPSSPARLAGALAVKGDEELLRAALALVGGNRALALPNGGAAMIHISDEEGAGDDSESNAVAAVLLHSPDLGPIEVRLRVTTAGVTAAVRTEPGQAAGLADEAAPQLASALASALARPANVTVAAFEEAGERPPAPKPEGLLDAYA